MLAGEERFELSISRVRAERFKPGLATPLHGEDGESRTRDLLTEYHCGLGQLAYSVRGLAKWMGSRTHLVLIDSEVPLPLGHHSA